jgi:predicted SAM-dependent methyltransferase
MKLNIGCGGVYKEGYINIDAFDKTIADECMSATDLRFYDDSVERIEADQLIEHLGFIEATYALSEWFRVLKPNGVLKMETPDVETSFKIYIKGNEDAKKNIFPWIFGLETPGLQHKCVFPKALLHDLLQKTGFTNIKEEFIETTRYRPTLRVTCTKPRQYSNYQIITHFRKQLLKNKIVDMNDQLVFLEQEKLMDIFRSKIIEFYKKKHFKVLDEIVIESAIYDPRCTSVFLDICVKNRIFPKNKIENHLSIVETLKKVYFSSILLDILRESPGFIGEQKRLFHIVQNFGRKSIKKLFSPTDKDEIMKTLMEIDREIKPKLKNKFFSEKIVESESNRLFQQGVKEFMIKNYRKSIDKFEESVNLFRNNIFNYWNLARLLSIQNRISEAENHYENALELSEKFFHPTKEQIQKSLNSEIKEIHLKKYTKPITTLNQISR